MDFYPFDVQMERENLRTFLKEFIEITFDFEAKSMDTLKGIEYY